MPRDALLTASGSKWKLQAPSAPLTCPTGVQTSALGNGGSAGGCSHVGLCGMGVSSKLSDTHHDKLGRSLMSFLFQDFAVCFAWMFPLPVSSRRASSSRCALLWLFARAGPSSHPHLDFCGGMIWMDFLYWWSLWRSPSVKRDVLIFRQRVKTKVAVRAVQFCVFTCLLTPRLKKPAVPPRSHV